MLTPVASPPDTVRFRFQITDSDGLHQAQLTTGSDAIACEKLSSESSTIEFAINDQLGLITRNGSLSLNVVDVYGSYTSQEFTVDITSLLTPTNVSIPDENLAAAIQDNLGLTSGSPITSLDMQKLRNCYPNNRQISDLTGIEYAVNLKYTGFNGNQIKDLTPLSGLTQLSDLQLGDNKINNLKPLAELTSLRYLILYQNQITDLSPLAELVGLASLFLQDNNISDITPLAGLTNLHFLYLSQNQIGDITPLKELTQLAQLFLSNNQITDVSPLAELVNLQELHLEGNPIKNRKPLFELLEKNPDVKIYLKWGGEPLPVTLSHFRAEHTDVGIVVKWTTESEIDNAGFYIYRSNTKDGEFKVVNPQMIQGAGTIGERNEYTWTDTTAKLNTVYYYRIEDVSHAGDRKQLATVRSRGLVSASGKLTTQWVTVKQ